MTPPSDPGQLYVDVGAKLAGELACRRCGKKVPLSAEQATEYLRSAWPICCEMTMQIVPAVVTGTNVNPSTRR